MYRLLCRLSTFFIVSYSSYSAQSNKGGKALRRRERLSIFLGRRFGIRAFDTLLLFSSSSLSPLVMMCRNEETMWEAGVGFAAHLSVFRTFGRSSVVYGSHVLQ